MSTYCSTEPLMCGIRIGKLENIDEKALRVVWPFSHSRTMYLMEEAVARKRSKRVSNCIVDVLVRPESAEKAQNK